MECCFYFILRVKMSLILVDAANLLMSQYNVVSYIHLI